jgi:hypothetical protein
VLLAGRAAELLRIGDASTGAGDDLAKATDLAQDMVVRHGMAPAVGPVCYRWPRPPAPPGHGTRLRELNPGQPRNAHRACVAPVVPRCIPPRRPRMRPSHRLTRLALAALGILASAHALAQAAGAADGTCPRTRAEVRAECIEFLRTHQWDEGAGNYVLKPGMKGPARSTPPEGVKSRAEVRAERDKFLRAHRWNEAASEWVPIAGTPRDLSTLSRAQMRKEMRAFVRTHRWDEGSESYVERSPRPKAQ